MSNAHNPKPFPFPFHDADKETVAAKKAHTLEEWVQKFLLNEGNHGLATALRTEAALMVDLIEIPLSLLNKIEGPEPVQKRETLDVWEERVSGLTLMIEEGYKPPPLIVTDFWKPFEIVDGNHRHEAMLRNNIEKYPTIFFIKNEESVKILEPYKS